MTLDVEGIVYGGLDVQKSLGRAWGFESLLFSLSPSDRLVRVLRTIVIDVLSGQAEGSNCDMIGSESIGCDPRWRPPVLLQQFPQQLQRRPGVPL